MEKLLLTKECINKAIFLFYCVLRSYTKMSSGPNQYEGAGTKTVNMFSKLVSQGSSFVMEGVKNLVVKRHVIIFFLIKS